MPSKRKYHVKGTKDFLVMAGIFFFLCIWAVKDAWYPSPKILEKHPHEISAAFETSGLLIHVHVAEGDSVVEGQLLAELGHAAMDQEFEAAKEAYSEARSRHELSDKTLRNAEKNGASGDGIAELEQNRDEAKKAMDAALEKVNEIRARLDASRLLAPDKGVVKKVLLSVHDPVEVGQPVMVMKPADHFYPFNKSLAIFSFIAFWVFLGIHILAQ